MAKKSFYRQDSEVQFKKIKELVDKEDKKWISQLISDIYESGREEALEEEQPN